MWPRPVGWVASMDVGEEGTEGFPGLDKRHGFFRAIQRNQVDRDSYHRQQQQEEVVTKSRDPADRRDRPDNGDKRKPAMELYRPPHHRGARRRNHPTKAQANQKQSPNRDSPYKSDTPNTNISNKSEALNINSSHKKSDAINTDSSCKSEAPNIDSLYKLEVELSPGEWHTVEVHEAGNGQSLADELASSFKMEQHMKLALAEMIEEFEHKLTTVGE